MTLCDLRVQASGSMLQPNYQADLVNTMGICRFFLQEVVGKPCGSGVSAWPVTGELLTIHIIERSQAG